MGCFHLLDMLTLTGMCRAVESFRLGTTSRHCWNIFAKMGILVYARNVNGFRLVIYGGGPPLGGGGGGGNEPKIVAHICFMLRIYLELHLKLWHHNPITSAVALGE